MQVRIDVKCMHTNFGGRGLSSFGDKISLLFHKSGKIQDRNWIKKLYASRGQCHVYVHQFWWVWSLWFRRYGYISKTAKFSHGHLKNLIDWKRLKKFMQVECHVHVYQFWWAWSFWFRRYGYISKTAKFPFWGMDYSPFIKKFNRSELAQKIYASRD